MINVLLALLYISLMVCPLLATTNEENEAVCKMVSVITGLSEIWTPCPITTGDPCSWPGIGCDVNLNIISIKLNPDIEGLPSLGGTLPYDISKLSFLQTLEIFVSKISGPIPTEIGQLTALKSLKLRYSDFSGPIPTHIGLLTNLTNLDLGFNALDHNIPKELGQLALLQTLELAGNKINGSLPAEIGALTTLTSVNLDFNLLTSLDTITTASFPNIQYFSAKLNRLSGSLPPLYNSATLTILNLSHNNLTGSIPEFFSYGVFDQIYLSYNQLSGDVPKFYNPKLRTLNLDHNKLTGPADSKWYCPILETLDISYNNLTKFPPGLIGTIRELFLEFNQIEQNIPADLPFVLNLKLSNNQIGGSLPSTLHYSYFNLLDLSNNLLSGSFPAVTQFPSLTTLILSQNNLIGPLPNITNSLLSALFLTNNSFNGTIPSELFSNDRLTQVYLDSNLLTGTIPDKLSNLTNLRELSLSGNQFSGSFPQINSPEINTLRIGLEQGQKPSLCFAYPPGWSAAAKKSWSSCDFNGLVTDCNNLPNCEAKQKCDETVKCGVNQCTEGGSLCRDERKCVAKPVAGYLCTETCAVNNVVEGPYECKAQTGFLLIVTLIPIFGFILILAIIIGGYCYSINNYDYGVNLPNDWFWDPHHIHSEGYTENHCVPPFFHKELKVDSKSKEMLLFNQFKENLDFDQIIFAKCWAISSRILATSMSNAFSVQKARFETAPDKFCSQKAWQQKNRDHRQKVYEEFRKRCDVWEWNRNKDVNQGLLLPVVHGTDLAVAWKIASAGFAALASLDSGFFGRGIYFSSSAMYTLPYFVNKRCPAILICLTAPGNPYPVIENPNNNQITMLGRPMMSGFQSHYVITAASGFPPSENKFDKVKRYDELVISQEAQVVPMFLVEVDTSNLNVLLTVFANKKNALGLDRSEVSEEHRSMDYHVSTAGEGERSLGDERGTLRNASSGPGKKRLNEQSNPATLHSASRKVDNSQPKRRVDAEQERKFDDSNDKQ